MSRTDRDHPKDPTHFLACSRPGCSVCFNGPWWKRRDNKRRRRALREVEAEQMEENGGRFRGDPPDRGD